MVGTHSVPGATVTPFCTRGYCYPILYQGLLLPPSVPGATVTPFCTRGYCYPLLYRGLQLPLLLYQGLLLPPSVPGATVTPPSVPGATVTPPSVPGATVTPFCTRAGATVTPFCTRGYSYSLLYQGLLSPPSVPGQELQLPPFVSGATVAPPRAPALLSVSSSAPSLPSTRYFSDAWFCTLDNPEMLYKFVELYIYTACYTRAVLYP